MSLISLLSNKDHSIQQKQRRKRKLSPLITTSIRTIRNLILRFRFSTTTYIVLLFLVLFTPFLLSFPIASSLTIFGSTRTSTTTAWTMNTTTTNSTTAAATSNNNKPPLRVALLGSGIFATTSHAPVLRSHPETFTTEGIWSRNIDHAIELAKTFPSDCKPYGGEEGLQAILSRKDIDAVIMALPLDVQPTYVRRVLEAGKHVLSEKPIAPTFDIGKSLLQEYKVTYQPKGLQWSVAENFRCEPGLIRAAEAVRNEIGKPLQISLTIHSPFTPDNKYLKTSWRSSPSWEGGLFIDAFVHGVAGLRMVAPSTPIQVSAITASHADHIPDIDTLAATVLFQDGVQGVLTVTYAVKEGYVDMVVTGMEGRMHLSRKFQGGPPGYQVQVVKSGSSNEHITTTEHNFGGIEQEFLTFARLCTSPPHSSSRPSSNYNPIHPEEALADLAFVEACIQSGKDGGKIRSVETVL